jgi:ceramide glucosyltransferase
MWHVGGHVVQIMLAVCTAASIAFYGVGVYGAWDFFRRQRHPRRVARPAAAPGVSILKPLKGLEADLAQNLGTYCCLDYPNYQIVFGVRDADDPAIEVVLQLRRDYPQARIDLVIDGRVYGTN